VPEAGEPSVFRESGISYLRIPAADPASTAAFYRNVFGWKVDLDRPDPSFEDGSGHVIGHVVADQEVAGESGIRPYVFVASIDEALAKATANGGALVIAPYQEGDLRVAAFRDPAGNVIGVWQRAG
jgi:uncharacterized protein